MTDLPPDDDLFIDDDMIFRYPHRQRDPIVQWEIRRVWNKIFELSSNYRPPVKSPSSEKPVDLF